MYKKNQANSLQLNYIDRNNAAAARSVKPSTVEELR